MFRIFILSTALSCAVNAMAETSTATAVTEEQSRKTATIACLCDKAMPAPEPKDRRSAVPDLALGSCVCDGTLVVGLMQKASNNSNFLRSSEPAQAVAFEDAALGERLGDEQNDVEWDSGVPVGPTEYASPPPL